MRFFRNICSADNRLPECANDSDVSAYRTVRPSGRTSRLTHSSSSLLRFFTRSTFTLIELSVSAVCKIGVLPFYYLKIIYKNDTSLRPQGRT